LRALTSSSSSTPQFFIAIIPKRRRDFWPSLSMPMALSWFLVVNPNYRKQIYTND
jgi:hypothetical protein